MKIGELKKILEDFDDDCEIDIIDYDQNNSWDIVEIRFCDDKSSDFYMKYLELVINI